MTLFKRLLIILLLAAPITFCHAQKKEIAQAKTYLKNSSNPQKAEELLITLLKDSANRSNVRIWTLLLDAVSKQYDQINEQLYLKQQSDTGKLFNAARRMFLICESLDSIDSQPDKSGKAELKFRKKHAEKLSAYRGNLFNGGMYFTSKRDFEQGFNFFDSYLDCARQPLFADYHYATADKRLPQAAFMATYCAYRQGNTSNTLKYADLAKQDTAKLALFHQYLADTYQTLGDTAKLAEHLSAGFTLQPTSLFFFPRLYDLYFKKGNIQQALSLCNQALLVDSINNVFSLAKSTALLTLERYDECITVCDQIIARNDSLPEAWLNAALAYYNQAVKIDSNPLKARKQRAELQSLYRKSLPYMQNYRKLAPKEQSVWGMPLYTIYMNLNMGKEFEEIDSLLRKTSKQ